MWESGRTLPPTPAAEAPVALTSNAGLSLLSPPDSPTFLGHNGVAEGVNDLFFASPGLAERVTNTRRALDEEAERLNLTNHYTLLATTPLSKPASPDKANSWWGEELAAASAEARRLQNRAFQL
ncbi:hypothetical protein JCM10213_003846 [Rhodosporidiobolus nylandii]